MEKQKYTYIKDGGDGYKTVDISDIGQETGYHLAYHHDDELYAGVWGLIDTTGNEVITPKYLFPLRFFDGVSVAVKGEWEYRKDWDGKYAGYWFKSNKIQYGLIDLKEKEIIPCQYSEVREIWDCDDNGKDLIKYFAAFRNLYRGDEGEPGMAILDRDGNMVVDFIYSDCDYYISNNQLVVAIGGEMYGSADVKCGVYDFRLGKEIVKPKYGDIEIEGYNLFRVSDDWEGDKDSYYLINEKEERV